MFSWLEQRSKLQKVLFQTSRIQQRLGKHVEWKLLMKHMLISIALAASLLVQQSNAQDATALTDQIAEALGYPASRLMTSDESVLYAEKTKGQTIAVYTINAGDQTFAPIAIAVGKRGTLLKPELESDCDAKINEASNSVVRFDLKSGIYGYAGLGMAGPGGSEERILATWPERGIDFQIKLSILREGLEFDDTTKAYYELVMNGGPQLAEKLVKCMEPLADHIEKIDLRSGMKAEQAAFSPAQPSALPGAQPHAPSPTSVVVQPNIPSTLDGDSSSTPWLIVVVLLVVSVVLMWLGLRGRK